MHNKFRQSIKSARCLHLESDVLNFEQVQYIDKRGRRVQEQSFGRLYNIFISWKTGYIIFKDLYEQMDNLKIHDTRLSNRNNESKVQKLLDAKLEETSLDTEENSRKSNQEKEGKKKTLPRYSFIFKGHKVRQSVEYEVEMVEKFVILGRTITEKYMFKTQYSKLQNLSLKLGTDGFPPKRLFGNKESKFIQRRKQDLQDYLNGRAAENSVQFFELVKQIKRNSFLTDYKSNFRLP